VYRCNRCLYMAWQPLYPLPNNSDETKQLQVLVQPLPVHGLAAPVSPANNSRETVSLHNCCRYRCNHCPYMAKQPLYPLPSNSHETISLQNCCRYRCNHCPYMAKQPLHCYKTFRRIPPPSTDGADSSCWVGENHCFIWAGNLRPQVL
jgi:hypothetical protein